MINDLMKRHEAWDGRHAWIGDPDAICQHCGACGDFVCGDDLDCPGPDYWGVENLLRLYLRMNSYINLEKDYDGGWRIETVDPELIMSMASVTRGRMYWSDADYVDPIVDLRKALEAAIVGMSESEPHPSSHEHGEE